MLVQIIVSRFERESPGLDFSYSNNEITQTRFRENSYKPVHQKT